MLQSFGSAEHNWRADQSSQGHDGQGKGFAKLSTHENGNMGHGSLGMMSMGSMGMNMENTSAHAFMRAPLYLKPGTGALIGTSPGSVAIHGYQQTEVIVPASEEIQSMDVRE